MPDPLSQGFMLDLNAQLLQALHAQPSRGVVLDMTGVQLLDAGDFSLLESLWKTCKLLGTRLVLAGLQPGTAAALTLLNVSDHWATAALSVEHAMEKLGK